MDVRSHATAEVMQPTKVAKTRERRWSIPAEPAVPQLMVVLDGTIVDIALPTAQHALNFSNSDRQWMVTAQQLAFESLQLLGG
jgi:hypothetical protein